MANRRSMSDAFDNSKMAFIRGEEPIRAGRGPDEFEEPQELTTPDASALKPTAPQRAQRGEGGSRNLSVNPYKQYPPLLT